MTVVILYSVLNRMKGSIKKKGYSYLQRVYLQRVYLQRGVTFKMLVGAHSQPIKRQNVLEAIMKRFYLFIFLHFMVCNFIVFGCIILVRKHSGHATEHASTPNSH